MAKLSSINKNERRKKLVKKYAGRYAKLKAIAAQRGITVAGFTAVPMLIAGVVGFNPVPAIVMVVGLGSVAWSLYLLYIGIPAVMKVPQDRGFLFASAVVAVCLVILIAMMGAGVILWDMFQPEFSN